MGIFSYEPFMMTIEEVFTIPDFGIVATGRIESGKISAGDEVEIKSSETTIWGTVKGIEMFRKLLDEAEAGDNVGLLLEDVEEGEISPGMIITEKSPDFYVID